MARKRGDRHCGPTALVPLAVALGLSPAVAQAQAPDGAEHATTCPNPEVVWANILKLVPSAAAELLVARPRVEILDAGETYRIRVNTSRGVLERAYSDAFRRCDERARFAAEFIVVALMPPRLADEAIDTTGTQGSGRPESPRAPPSSALAAPLAVTAKPRVPGSTKEAPQNAAQSMPAIVRFEAAAVANGAPALGGNVGVFEWAAELRTAVGSGLFAAVGALAVAPKQPFEADGVRAALTRLPVALGVRVRPLRHGIAMTADLALAIAFERYESAAVGAPGAVNRTTPGVEAAVAVSPQPVIGFGPFLSVRCAWFPISQDLVVPPQIIGHTPSLWIGGALGIAFGL